MIAVDTTTTTTTITTTSPTHSSITSKNTTTGKHHYYQQQVTLLRSQILQLGASVGQLCAHFLSSLVPLDPRHDNNNHDDHPPHDNHNTTTVTQKNTSSTTSSSNFFWSTPSSHRDMLYLAIAKIFWNLLEISKIANIDLSSSILKKMELNARKYPVHLCKGKSGKYTKYSNHTGITENNQSLLDISLESTGTTSDEGNNSSNSHSNTHNNQSNNTTTPTTSTSHSVLKDSCGSSSSSNPTTTTTTMDSMTVSEIIQSIREFALERHWSQYHTPRNIVLAMMGEMGELAEIFQWMGDYHGSCNSSDGGGDDCDIDHGDDNDEEENNLWKEKDKDHLEQELADVSIYCLRLADVVGIGEDFGSLLMS